MVLPAPPVRRLGSTFGFARRRVLRRHERTRPTRHGRPDRRHLAPPTERRRIDLGGRVGAPPGTTPHRGVQLHTDCHVASTQPGCDHRRSRGRTSRGARLRARRRERRRHDHGGTRPSGRPRRQKPGRPGRRDDPCRTPQPARRSAWCRGVRTDRRPRSLAADRERCGNRRRSDRRRDLRILRDRGLELRDRYRSERGLPAGVRLPRSGRLDRRGTARRRHPAGRHGAPCPRLRGPHPAVRHRRARSTDRQIPATRRVARDPPRTVRGGPS